MLVVRTRRVFYRSRPGAWLLRATVRVALLVLALPVIGPVARVFGFVPLPLALYGAILGVVGGYVLTAEGLKQWFYRKFPG